MAITAIIYACKPGMHDAGPMLEDLELDKYWHGLHYLLCGSNEKTMEISSFILSGVEIEGASDADVFLHEPTEVKSFSEYLETITTKNLSALYNHQKMSEIGIYGNFEESQFDLNNILKKFEELKEFVGIHAKNGN